MSSRILIVTAVEAERKAIEDGLKVPEHYHVIAGGAGPASAAAATAAALASDSYKLVINAGIGGGFPGRAELGDIVISTEIIQADLGSETAEGFRSVDELGFGTSRVTANPDAIQSILSALQTSTDIPVHCGPIITVSTTTGTAQTAEELLRRIPEACAESMEGYGVAAAASYMNVPVLEIRAISNTVGPRNRDAWRIPEALQALTTASQNLSEVL
ncbi:futalosine hydrolase [Paenibacillus sp. FSL H7-0326]|uniref:futalosine hydrolase n=1 Tax=Paenibacillus sp. FSL H7-0326 TaxID=1921144 RepID=UPI00096FE44A|nr:futalosine hydrolase [Paenibacillus sp. FSL H7-0326]OMC72062.1 futalosine hydrolase [Paenibacillus sp. FSL H7-0326]